MCLAVTSGPDIPSPHRNSHQSESDHDFRALTECELDALEEARELVSELLRERLGIFSLPVLRADLPLLQELVDDATFNPLRPAESAAIGIVFGDVMVSELGIEWCAFISVLGPDLAIATEDFRLALFPSRIFLSRIEDGERVDLDALFEQLARHLNQSLAPLPTFAH